MTRGRLAEGDSKPGGHGDHGPISGGVKPLAPDIGSPDLSSVEMDEGRWDLLNAEAVASKLQKRLVFRWPIGHDFFSE